MTVVAAVAILIAVAQLVIAAALIGIGEDRIGMRDSLKLLGVTPLIRMVLDGFLLVGS